MLSPQGYLPQQSQSSAEGLEDTGRDTSLHTGNPENLGSDVSEEM